MIHLVRHGRSSLIHDGRWFTPGTVASYEDAYDAAGIRDDSHPPRELIELAASVDVVAASDMARAIESIRRLAPGRNHEVVPELRELRLEPPRWLPIPLPIDVWDAMSHAQWSWRLALGSDSAFVRQAAKAADWLASRVAAGASVAAVTHGGIRRIIDAQLARRGFRRVPGSNSYDNWSAWSYRRG